MINTRNGRGEDAFVRMATEIVSGFVKNNPVERGDLPHLIQTVHRTLLALAETASGSQPAQTPAVAPEDSVHNDYLVCLEDGQKLKMLKRHLRSRFGLTPEQYRAKWNLPASYPMVAPGYAKKRSRLAKEIGLGRKATYLNRK